MKRYTLALFCLLAGPAFAEVPSTLYVRVNNNLEIGRSEDDQDYVTHCAITDNNGNQFTLFPQRDLETTERFRLDGYNKCRVYIYGMNKNDTGQWKVHATINNMGLVNTKEQVFNVVVKKFYQEKTSIPIQKTEVYPNQQVFLKFKEQFDNLCNCKLLNPEQKEYDLKSENSTDIKLFGQCGFRMKVKEEYSGSSTSYSKWTLIADLNNDTVFYSQFFLLVKNPSDLEPNQTTVIFRRGDSGILKAGKKQNVILCRMEDPHGVKYPMRTGFCAHEIPIVTKYHDGVWKAYYGIRGIEHLVEEKILVQTYGKMVFSKELNSTILYENDDIHLLCQVDAIAKYCTFVRPDGKILVMTIGVGDEKYQYYGKGVQPGSINGNGNEFDCGLTIHKPNSIDYGAWRCILHVYNDKPVGRVLKVSPNSRSAMSKSTTSAKNVYAKLGDSFTVKCTAEEMLSYCWLRSPDGKIHKVVQNDKVVDPPALKYEGITFELGDCSATIRTANKTDAGYWTCHMGVVNGSELETSFKVFVTETNLMADPDVVNTQPSKETTLSCRPLPGSNNVIETCHWVNPIGRGINVEREGRYITEINTMDCKLTIRVFNAAEDIGEWSCFARFGDNQEGSARILVR